MGFDEAVGGSSFVVGVLVAIDSFVGLLVATCLAELVGWEVMVTVGVGVDIGSTTL